jgi:hypothetical protein
MALDPLRNPVLQAPIHAPLCPICGKPNNCAVSTAGRFDGACWCKDARFSKALLDAVPSELKGKACICRSCAQGKDQATPWSNC